MLTWSRFCNTWPIYGHRFHVVILAGYKRKQSSFVDEVPAMYQSYSKGNKVRSSTRRFLLEVGVVRLQQFVLSEWYQILNFTAWRRKEVASIVRCTCNFKVFEVLPSCCRDAFVLALLYGSATILHVCYKYWLYSIFVLLRVVYEFEDDKVLATVNFWMESASMNTAYFSKYA